MAQKQLYNFLTFHPSTLPSFQLFSYKSSFTANLIYFQTNFEPTNYSTIQPSNLLPYSFCSQPSSLPDFQPTLQPSNLQTFYLSSKTFKVTILPSNLQILKSLGLPALQSTNLPCIKPSSCATFYPSNLLTIQPSSLQSNSLPTVQPFILPSFLYRPSVT